MGLSDFAAGGYRPPRRQHRRRYGPLHRRRGPLWSHSDRVCRSLRYAWHLLQQRRYGLLAAALWIDGTVVGTQGTGVCEPENTNYTEDCENLFDTQLATKYLANTNILPINVTYTLPNNGYVPGSDVYL